MIKMLPLPDEPKKAYYLEDWDKAKGYTQPLPFAEGKSITLGVDDSWPESPLYRIQPPLCCSMDATARKTVGLYCDR